MYSNFIFFLTLKTCIYAHTYNKQNKTNRQTNKYQNNKQTKQQNRIQKTYKMHPSSGHQVVHEGLWVQRGALPAGGIHFIYTANAEMVFFIILYLYFSHIFIAYYNIMVMIRKIINIQGKESMPGSENDAAAKL